MSSSPQSAIAFTSAAGRRRRWCTEGEKEKKNTTSFFLSHIKIWRDRDAVSLQPIRDSFGLWAVAKSYVTFHLIGSSRPGSSLRDVRPSPLFRSSLLPRAVVRANQRVRSSHMMPPPARTILIAAITRRLLPYYSNMACHKPYLQIRFLHICSLQQESVIKENYIHPAEEKKNHKFRSLDLRRSHEIRFFKCDRHVWCQGPATFCLFMYLQQGRRAHGVWGVWGCWGEETRWGGGQYVKIISILKQWTIHMYLTVRHVSGALDFGAAQLSSVRKVDFFCAEYPSRDVRFSQFPSAPSILSFMYLYIYIFLEKDTKRVPRERFRDCFHVHSWQGWF